MRKPSLSRLNLALPLEARARLDNLQRQTDTATLSETVVDAIRFYEWLVQKKKAGVEIFVREPGKDMTLVEFIL